MKKNRIRISETYKVIVDYDKTPSKMIKAGKYGSSVDFTDMLCTDMRCKLKGSGQHEVNLVLVHLDEDATTEEVKEYLKKQGLESAKIEHLLAFGATYPNIQREFPVIALGSEVVDYIGHLRYPCLSFICNERWLSLYRYNPWYGTCRFLAVRK